MPDSKPSYSSFKNHPLKTSSRLSNSNKDKTGHADSSLNSSAGKRLNAAGALLKDKHPELFYVPPRPGGFIKNVICPHRDPSKTNVAGHDKSHSKRPMATGTETKPVSINDVLDTQIPCPTFHRFSKDEERNNMVRMCSIAMSTVIMLAQHTYDNITVEHVKHTEAYFRALRQEDGYPQNIGQLMQVLANLKRSGQIVTPPPDEEESEEDEEDTEDIQISDIIN